MMTNEWYLILMDVIKVKELCYLGVSIHTSFIQIGGLSKLVSCHSFLGHFSSTVASLLTVLALTVAGVGDESFPFSRAQKIF